MEFLPRSMGTRPRLACEVSAEGVVAARAEDAFAVLSAATRVLLADEVVVPRLTAIEADGTVDNSTDAVSSVVGGSAKGRAAVVSAVRKALEAVAVRTHEVTLVVPDASARVLLLDFDELPAKPAEALPVVRFRLKKLLPFDADDAAISYQVMSATKGSMQVLAVAMPRELQADYENVVREAGFEPGAILPSTIAALAGLAESEFPQLVVNASHEGVTTAIVKGGVLLLHRTVDLGADQRADLRADQQTRRRNVEPMVNLQASQPAMAAGPVPLSSSEIKLSLVDREHTAEEWAQQEPLTLAEQNAVAVAVEPEATREIADEGLEDESADENAYEVAQAISVAGAYFEDTLGSKPTSIHIAGTLGAKAITALLADAGIGPLPVREMLHAEMIGPGATNVGTPGGVPLGWLAGVRGALTN